MIPRFSIIVPLYNKAPYVRKAIDSVVSQTFKDWECIIVDDGSTDGSAVICEEFIHSLTPSLVHSFCLLRQANNGVAAARNNGVAKSHGEYLCFLDADDWWEPTFLEEMEKLIVEYPNAGIYATNYIYYKPGKTHVALSLPRGYMDYPKAYYEGSSMPVWTGATCMLRKVFDEMGGFSSGIKLGEDFLLWAKTALHYPVAYSEKHLAYYNNDVPATMRATRNLHAPQYHMLFHLEPLEEEIQQTSNIKHQTSHTVHRTPYTIHRDAWMRLLDKMRISGLLDYWLDERYHDAAAIELAKVDWSKQPKSAKAQYEKPIWFLRSRRNLLQIGSYCKQMFIRNSSKIREFIRFGIVGVTVTGLHYGLYYLLNLVMNVNIAYTIGYVVALLCNFYLTAYFTFKSNTSVKRGIGFVLSHGINYLLHMSLLNLFLWLGLSETWAPIPVFCIAIPINFLLVRYVFKSKYFEK